MKLKRLISVLLISIYLFAVGGQAFAPLTCECLAAKAQVTHVCCHDCPHAGPVSVQAHCCDHHHSNDIELYTYVSSFDNEDDFKCVVLNLPATMSAECPCPGHIPFLREKTAERSAPFIREVIHLTVSFRAPPALA